MAEYIERETLMKRLKASPLIKNYLIMRGSQNLINGIFDIIEKQPTADVVEVVMCKDCKYSRPRNKSEKNIYFEDVLICESCEMADEPCAVCETDYCSYGELKECDDK